MADFCRFLILTKIVLNHMTETAKILPKGLTVERNDFDRCLGRIPNKIATGEGFSGFTADQ